MNNELIKKALNRFKIRCIFDESYCNDDLNKVLEVTETEFIHNRKQTEIYENNSVFNKYCFSFKCSH